MATETAYSAEDYRRALASKSQWMDADDPLIRSALAIAARVMEPGVIENAYIGARNRKVGTVSAAIRAALTGGSNG